MLSCSFISCVTISLQCDCSDALPFAYMTVGRTDYKLRMLSQLIGSGNDKELFYTDSRCKQAYKNYVSMLLTRTNTYTGVQYKNDPTMFSFELMVSQHISLYVGSPDYSAFTCFIK